MIMHLSNYYQYHSWVAIKGYNSSNPISCTIITSEATNLNYKCTFSSNSVSFGKFDTNSGDPNSTGTCIVAFGT